MITEEELIYSIELVLYKNSKPVDTTRFFTDKYARDTIGDLTIKEISSLISECIIETIKNK